MRRILTAAVVLVSGLFLPLRTEADELALAKEGEMLVWEVQKGDTLWDLADDFYDNPFLFEKIWKANPFISDPHWIYPGQMHSLTG